MTTSLQKTLFFYGLWVNFLQYFFMDCESKFLQYFFMDCESKFLQYFLYVISLSILWFSFYKGNRSIIDTLFIANLIIIKNYKKKLKQIAVNFQKTLPPPFIWLKIKVIKQLKYLLLLVNTLLFVNYLLATCLCIKYFY